MVGIVLSDNLLITFMCWEMVGFASYLLIGFWMEKTAAAKASKKAFLINRIGDAGFLIGLCIIYATFGTFDLSAIKVLFTDMTIPNVALFTIAGLGIFMGCVGKSAQFPLQLWLPDAMEGPTPASALIHAATMVAAGIYLLAKTYFLLTLDTLTVIAFIGAITAFVGALPAAAQTDIKKVLAFSTISQLGFMVMAMGVGAYDAALFHLITHAFFKACLFLTAGAVIHEMHHMKQALFIRGYFHNFDALNMKLMGGLRKKMPITFIAYFLSCMALIGVPLFSGFLSKDAILEGAFNWAIQKQNGTGSYIYYLIPISAILSVSITAYYMIRQMILVFFGSFKLKTFYPQVEQSIEKIHDPGWMMKAPMLLLGILSLWFFFSLNPLSGHHGWIMEKLALTTSISLIPIEIVISISTAAVIAGGGFAWYRFKPSTYNIAEDDESLLIKRILKNNWYIDYLYQKLLVLPGLKFSNFTVAIDVNVIDRFIHFLAYTTVIFAYFIALFDKYIIDGLVVLAAKTSMVLGSMTRSFQQGAVQRYFLYTISIIVVVFIWLIST